MHLRGSVRDFPPEEALPVLARFGKSARKSSFMNYCLIKSRSNSIKNNNLT
jgi:hypothetical protein